MFGHQDDQQNQHTDNLLPDLPHDAALTGNQNQPGAPGSFPAAVPAQDQSQPEPFNPALPSDSSVFTGNGGSSDGDDTPAAPPAPDQQFSPASDQDNSPAPHGDTNQLLDIKQHALQQLSPLVSHLDQNPEEKFRTTMMMIQASDNQDLIQVAYEAAQAIQDEKTKAQALLDIVNEINYFTHNQQPPQGQ